MFHKFSLNLPCPVCKGSNIELFDQIDHKNYFECHTCRAIFLDRKSHLTFQDEKERYSQHNNDIYDSEYRRFLSRLYNPIVQKIPLGAMGLDYGCGPGPALAQGLVLERHQRVPGVAAVEKAPLGPRRYRSWKCSYGVSWLCW